MFDAVILGVASQAWHVVSAMAASLITGIYWGARLALKRLKDMSPIEGFTHIFIASLLVLLCAYVVSRLPTTSNEPVLGAYTSPVEVLTTVEGVQGPAVRERGLLTIRQTRCVNAEQVVPVLSIRGFVNVGAPSNDPVFDQLLVEANRDPGCPSVDIPITLPEAVTEGTWIVTGEDRLTSGDEKRQWNSVPFRVVEAQ